MKKFALATALCAFSFAVSAQTTPSDSNVTIVGKSLSAAKAADARHMDQVDFYHFAGSYDLANGDTLSLANHGSLFFAKVGGQAWHRIVSTGDNSFVALDQQLKMRIDRKDDGNVSGEVLIAAPASQMANSGAAGGGFVAVAFR